MLAPKLANIAATRAPLVATGNPGCLMQIGAGLRQAGMTARVVHPVDLLDASYAASEISEDRATAADLGRSSRSAGTRHGALLSPMVDAVLLEWEGVLADTGAARREALLRALADEGVSFSAEAYDAHCAGLDVQQRRQRVRWSGVHDDDPALLDLVVAAGAARIHGTARRRCHRSLPGALAFLRAARSCARRLAMRHAATRAETDLVAPAGRARWSRWPCVFTADDVLQRATVARAVRAGRSRISSGRRRDPTRRKRWRS